MLDRHETIQTRAYALWENMGCPHGADRDHWIEAEKLVDSELLKGFKPQKAPAKAKVKKAGKAA